MAHTGRYADPAVHGGATSAGFAALQRRLAASGAPPADVLVVMEATGNSWVALAVTLHEADYRVAVVNPRQAHHCAKAQLRRAKTDALDARDLAQLAAALRPAPWTPVLAEKSIWTALTAAPSFAVP